MNVKWVRSFVAFLILVALGLAAVPMLVLLDLAASRDGYGLCPDGLEGCRTAYTAAPELLVALVVALFAVLGLLRVVMRYARRLERTARYGSPPDLS